jgi:ketosteroid isomerase-like protein
MPSLSEELRAIADTAFGALNAGDLDSFLSVVSEDAEFTSMIAEVEGQTYRGHEGVRTWWNTVAGTFQSVRWELLEVEGSGGRGLARLRAVGEVGGVEVEQTVWQAARYQDGKLDWWAFFRAESDAREAAGIVRGQA